MRRKKSARSWSAQFTPVAGQQAPWEFIVARGPEYGRRLREQLKKPNPISPRAAGWKWIPHYRLDFVSEAPVLIVVVGDPAKTAPSSFRRAQQRLRTCLFGGRSEHLPGRPQSGTWPLFGFLYMEKSDARAIFGVPGTRTRWPLCVWVSGPASRRLRPARVSRKRCATSTEKNEERGCLKCDRVLRQLLPLF
jgi:hypothetical protein